jgi:uncharacterized protein (DUF2236 family)
MTNSLFPADDEIAALAPGPDSLLWRYFGDARTGVASGYALLLQVAHPTIAGGVRDHSNYKQDPWGRLLGTLDFLVLMIYGGPEAAAETGRRLREMHRHIRGALPDGRRYNALEPGAFAWVHATLIEANLAGHRHFGCQLTDAETERIYAEWLKVGRLLGMQKGALPDDWSGFRSYFDEMVDARLEDNDVVQGVLTTFRRPARGSFPVLGERFWRLTTVPAGRVLSLTTAGLMPPTLRDRLGLSWTRRQELAFRGLGAVSRSTTPVLPARLRNTGPDYLRWRRRDIARGEFASSAPRKTLPSAA